MPKGKAHKRPPPPARYPCIFMGPEVRSTDDVIQDAWKARFGVGAPFGSLRKEWRREHCRTINPYGSDGCPFERADCIAAFREAVLESLLTKVIDPRVYFIAVAKTRGMQRAENKPREAHRSETSSAARPGQQRAVASGDPARRLRDLAAYLGDDPVSAVEAVDTDHLRPRLARPTRIGALLGSPDGRPRQGRPDDRNADRETTNDPSAE